MNPARLLAIKRGHWPKDDVQQASLINHGPWLQNPGQPERGVAAMNPVVQQDTATVQPDPQLQLLSTSWGKRRWISSIQ